VTSTPILSKSTINQKLPPSIPQPLNSLVFKPLPEPQPLNVLLDKLQSIVSRHQGDYLFLRALALSKLPNRNDHLLEIRSLFEEAAQVGHVDAAFNAGLCYDVRCNFDLVPDSTRAIVYYTQAAYHNHKRAQFRLGMLLLELSETNEQLQQGLEWLEKAAQAEYQPAMDTLNNYRTLCLI
jgi:hypothetical protein